MDSVTCCLSDEEDGCQTILSDDPQAGRCGVLTNKETRKQSNTIGYI